MRDDKLNNGKKDTTPLNSFENKPGKPKLKIKSELPKQEPAPCPYSLVVAEGDTWDYDHAPSPDYPAFTVNRGIAEDAPTQVASAAKRTKLVILIGVFFYILWDLYTYFTYGGQTTESTTVGNWLVTSLWVCVLVGGLIGHLAASGPAGAIPWRSLGVMLAAAVMGFLVTRY